jgi:hypothetical protein
MKFLACLLMLLACLSVPAVAAPLCYAPPELEAEQLLRLHSELMVITVTCRYGSTGQELVPSYTRFTQSNLKDIQNAEQTLIGYYKKNYKGDGVSRLDQLRTRLGNEFGQKIADMSAPTFCAQYRDRVTLLSGYQPAQVSAEATQLSVSAHNYAPVCGKKKGKKS